MYRNRSKQLLAIFLIANFILCNTPTAVLHTLFANHTDQKITCNVDPSIIHFDVAGLDCHCNTNVVHTPYLQPTVQEIPNPPVEYFIYRDAGVAGPANIYSWYFSLRAPPFLS